MVSPASRRTNHARGVVAVFKPRTMRFAPLTSILRRLRVSCARMPLGRVDVLFDVVGTVTQCQSKNSGTAFTTSGIMRHFLNHRATIVRPCRREQNDVQNVPDLFGPRGVAETRPAL